jgi:5-formyltetrahydrofolate cyclo-ligase
VTDSASRNQLRRTLRAQRNALSLPQQAHAARRLAAQVAALRLFRVSRRVAVYLPNDGEIDPVPLIMRLWQSGKICYLPILSRLRHDRLWFAPYLPDTALAVNRLGILEPATAARTWTRAQELDLILMPLVAFDTRGNRLGMGGGFYDKSLAFLRTRSVWRKPHLIGLAHDFQRVDKLAANAWDVPLQAVATDCGVYRFG